MCGIAGFVGIQPTGAPQVSLRAMCDAIVHRGPDDQGAFHASGVALGMRRLSVIDPAMGQQPMYNEDGTVALVFNGEIYNHRELRRGLLTAGHDVRTTSDTEVIVHLYEERGDDVVDVLRGMFAFALWDATRARLLVARDRLGIKPLYYYETPNGLAFCSELRSLLALPDFRPRVSAEAVAQYLTFGYVPDSHCIFEGVHKLQPGHRLVWERSTGVRVSRYWTPVRQERVNLEVGEAVEELRALLRESVELHLESDVPLGAFLSGGIDSSAVVAQMSRLMTSRVKTFSIGFEEDAFNEAPHAAAVARAIGTDHTELIVRPDADALVEDVLSGFDEPFGDSSALPTFLVSQLAREHVTVALSGDGGDELFGGYTRYSDTLARRELPAIARSVLARFARVLPHGARGRNRFLDLSRTMSGRYAATVAMPASVSEGGVMVPGLAGTVSPMNELLASPFGEMASRDLLAQMTMTDLVSYLPGDILTKVDRMSMSVSLECRVPLLDHHLVEFAVSVPSTLKYRDGTGKWLLRQAIVGLVPDSVLTHPKQGFAIPMERWFRGALRYRLEALCASASQIRPFIDEEAVRRVVAEHLAGRRDHSMMLWRLLALQVWLDALGTGRLAQASPLAPAVKRAAMTST